MPEYTITGRYQQIHHFRWTGSAASSITAERYVKGVLMGASEGDDLSQSGLQLTNTYCALQQVKVQEVGRTAPKTATKRAPERPDTSHPLYLLHTTWRAASPQDRREFLRDLRLMLTREDLRVLAQGDDEEEG